MAVTMFATLFDIKCNFYTKCFYVFYKILKKNKPPLVFKTDATVLICTECLNIAHMVVTEYLRIV